MVDAVLESLLALEHAQDPCQPLEGSDGDLIRRARGGDRGAFAALVERYSARAFTLARRLAPDAAAAEDLAQEAFLRVYQALDRFDPARPFFPWLVTIVRNLARNELRRRLPEPRGDAGELPGATPRAGEGGPATRVLEADSRREILAALAGLPHQYKEVVALRFLEDRPVKEIAALLAMPEGTVKTLLFRARDMLRRTLKGDGA